jgi:hypothetical protein
VLFPLGWGMSLKLSAILGDGPVAPLIGFGGTAIFLFSPFIVSAVRGRRRRNA